VISAGESREGGKMGWSIGFDTNWNRDIGYGVPAWCDHPKCSRLINRGLSFVCGGEPYGGEKGCGLNFCGKHLTAMKQLCNRCAVGSEPFPPKADHPEWVRWKLTDESWAEWRKTHPEFEKKAAGAAERRRG